MRFGIDSLSRLSRMIRDRELEYGDSVVIGDNSSGKSLLLRLLITDSGETDGIYFIDAVNRGFDAEKIIEVAGKPEYKSTIIRTRIQEEYFNLKDSFNCYGTLTERVEQIYHPYEEPLQDLFHQLTGECFRTVQGSVLGEVQFANGSGLLSSGYQAIVRLLLELLYYQEKGIQEKQLNRAMVVIDELDEFLSPGYAFKIFPFLKEKFPQMDLIVTTHSCDLVAGTQNANLIVLDNTKVAAEYEVMDINDYQSISQVQLVFDRVFGAHLPKNSETEDILRRLFNNRLNKAWTEEDQLQLEQLKERQLTASQQLIWKQIMEW